MSVATRLLMGAHRKPIPSGIIVQPNVRTNYDLDALGSALDPLWTPNGKHTGGQGAIDIVNDPSGIARRVQRHTVHSGDIFSGGDRCEVMTTDIGGGEGARFQVRFDLYLPSNFSSDNSGWNSLWDMHYPNNGPAQSPLTASIRNGNELWLRVFGGPVSSDGTLGTVRNEQKFATLTKGAWNELGFDILQHATSGLMDAWVNKTKVTTWGSIPTVSPNVPNTTYWKQGFYRPQNSSSGTQIYYFTDTMMWISGTPDNMLNWTPS